MKTFQVSFVLKLFAMATAILTWHSSPRVTATPQSAAPLVLQALGREASLGSLYNAFDETFSEMTIFRRPLTQSLIQTTDISWTNTQYVFGSSVTDGSRILDIGLELKASLVYGLIELKGSAKFLREDTMTRNSVTAFFDYKARTKRDQVNLFYDNVQPFINPAMVNSSGNIWGTHVVIAIDSGVDVVAKFSDTVTRGQTRDEVKDNLKFVMQAIMSSFGRKEQCHGVVANSTQKSMAIKLFGDVQLGSSQPRTYEEFVQLMQGVPELIKKQNDGRGKPMTYTLLPLDLVAHHLSRDPTESSTRLVHSVDQEKLEQLLRVKELAAGVEADLRDLQQTFEFFAKCLEQQVRDKLDSLQSSFKLRQNQFSEKVKDGVIAIRRGLKNNSYLDELTADYAKEELHPTQIKTALGTKFKDALDKTKVCSIFIKSPGIDYLRGPEGLWEIKRNNWDRNIYVLWYSSEWILGKEKEWREVLRLFFNQLGQNAANKLVVVDCGLGQNLSSCSAHVNGTTVQQYRNDFLMSDNVQRDLSPSVFSGARTFLPTIHWPAMGSWYVLGEVFDVRSGKFLQNSILKREFWTKAVNSVPSFSSSTRVLHPHRMRYGRIRVADKMAALKVPSMMTIQILTGNFPMMRSGLYFEENCLAPFDQPTIYTDGAGEYATSKFGPEHPLTTGILANEIVLWTDSVNTDVSLGNAFSLSKLGKDGATHFLRKITYGARSIFQLTTAGNLTVYLQRDLETLKRFIDETLKTPNPSLDRNSRNHQTAVSSPLATESEPLKFESGPLIKVFTDVSESPRHFENEAQLEQFLKGLSREVAVMNEGKGRPVKYELEPLENIPHILGVLPANSRSSPLCSSSEAATKETLTALLKLDAVRLEILGQREFFKENEKNLPESYREMIDQYDDQLKDHVGQMVPKIQSHLPKLRDANNCKNLSRELQNQFANPNFQPGALASKIKTEFSWSLEKVNLLNLIRKKYGDSVGFLGKDSTLDDIFVLNDSAREIYVLYFGEKLQSDHGELWRENLHAFFSLFSAESPPAIKRTEQSTSKFLVDCDFDVAGAACDVLSAPAIYKYTDGILTHENLLQELKDQRESEAWPVNKEMQLEHLKSVVDSLQTRMDQLKQNLNEPADD